MQFKGNEKYIYLDGNSYSYNLKSEFPKFPTYTENFKTNGVREAMGFVWQARCK